MYKVNTESSISTLASLAECINNHHTNSNNNIGGREEEDEEEEEQETETTSNQNETHLNGNNHKLDENDCVKIILPDFLEVDINDLIFYDRCGDGAYGCVYRAHWKSRDKEVAVKKLLQLDNEANVLSKLSHRNIIRFYGVASNKTNSCIITEFAKNGSLQAFIHSHKLHSEYGLDLILKWAKDIALGMNYLHEEAPTQIIHRDLKSTNVVISEDMVCKICDFGTSIFDVKTTKMTIIGTVPWMSPEIMQGLAATKKCDIWSYGVVLWELITGQLPFKGLGHLQITFLILIRQERLPIPSGCPPILSELMSKCWKAEPTERPNFKEILETLDQCCSTKTKVDINNQIEEYKAKWESEIEIVFEKLKKMEQDLSLEKRILEEREKKLRDQEINLIKNFKIITIEDYDVNSWREIDVYEWIKKICQEHSFDASIAEIFLGNNINGRALLKLNKEDLKSMGILVGPLISLNEEIQRLRTENTRLLNFPPLKYQPSTTTQISTKELTFKACLCALIIQGDTPEEHKWKMLFDVDDTDDNNNSKETNVLSYIRDVKFVNTFHPFQQYNISKPPYIMQKWVKEISNHSKIDCIVTFEDKILKPRNIKLEFVLDREKNKSLTQEITVTLENSITQSISISTSASTQSLTSVLLSAAHHSYSSGTISDNVWKTRVLENSVVINEPKKNQPDLWSGVVTGKYRTNNSIQNNNTNTVMYKPQTSANVLLKTETQKSNSGVDKNAVKYKRRNTYNECSKFNRTYSNSKFKNNSTGNKIDNNLTVNNDKSIENSLEKSSVVFDLGDSDSNSTHSTTTNKGDGEENKKSPYKKEYNNPNNLSFRSYYREKKH